MSIKSTIPSTTGAIINVLDTISVGLGIYSVGKYLNGVTYLGIGNLISTVGKELSNGINTLPINNTYKNFLQGGQGYQDCKPNWTKLNEFIEKNPYYPALMYGEKLAANAVVGFHTNLTLILLLYSIIDDMHEQNDTTMLCVAGFICGVDILHAWTAESTTQYSYPELN
jgi:hypothetical protein